MSTSYPAGMDDATARLPHEAAEAASDSVGGAHEAAAQMAGAGGAELVALADQSFVEAMTTSASVAAAVALVGALVAAAFLPSRARPEHVPAPADVAEPAAA